MSNYSPNWTANGAINRTVKKCRDRGVPPQVIAKLLLDAAKKLAGVADPVAQQAPAPVKSATPTAQQVVDAKKAQRRKARTPAQVAASKANMEKARAAKAAKQAAKQAAEAAQQAPAPVEQPSAEPTLTPEMVAALNAWSHQLSR